MNIKEIIDKEIWSPENSEKNFTHNLSLARIEEAVNERIKGLERQVNGYERLLDEAFDAYLNAADNWELRDILKDLIDYAPRKKWEDK
jgi:hypothetical protein